MLPACPLSVRPHCGRNPLSPCFLTRCHCDSALTSPCTLGCGCKHAQVFVTASTDSTIHLWDVRALGSKMKPLATAQHSQTCQAAFFAPDGGWALGGRGAEERVGACWADGCPARAPCHYCRGQEPAEPCERIHQGRSCAGQHRPQGTRRCGPALVAQLCRVKQGSGWLLLLMQAPAEC
jgi:hypothetical protein